MKKLFLLTALTAGLIAVAACKKDKPVNPEVLPEPAEASLAKKLDLADNAQHITSIEFTEAGRYIITFYEADPDDYIATKSFGYMYRHITGAYTFNNNTYNLEGYGKVTINGSNVTVTPTDGTETTARFTEQEAYPEWDFLITLARTWKVDNTRVAVTMNGNAVTVTKQGCDIPSIAEELRQKGVQINTESVAGYVVEDIIFTRNKTFAIEFTGRDPFVSEFVLAQNQEFSIKTPQNNGLSLSSIQGHMDYVPDDQQLVINLSVHIESDAQQYDGSILLFLSEVR